MPRSSNPSGRKLSWRKKLLFATATTAGFFLILEGTLALFGVKPLTVTGDPFVGFSGQLALFESDSDSATEQKGEEGGKVKRNKCTR